MRLRAFAAAWTVFTMLAAPALLLAADEVPPEQPTPDLPAVSVPPPEPQTEVAPEEAAPAAQPAPEQPATEQPAPAPVPAPQPAADSEAPKAKAKRKPVARAATSATVSIKDFAFSPTSVTINVGDSVTWTNAGPSVHTATGSGFDTGNLSKGGSGSHTFSSAGTFSYICTPHPFMKASVTVAGASSGDDTGTATDDGSTGSTADEADGPSLANTGADAWALVLIGTGLLSLGAAVRRRTGSA